MQTNSKSIIITGIATLAIGLFLGWVFFGGAENQHETEHSHTTEVNDETIWTCSMHPQIRQQEPGDCPICGMDLIPLEAEQGEIDPMAISMSPTAMQLANVSTAVVGTMQPVKTIRLNGKVQEDERLVLSQTSHFPGRIERLAVTFTGEYVRKGQPVAYSYSPELVTAQEELFEAYQIRETQPQLYNAARNKLLNWKLTESQINGIVESGSVTREFPILADKSGYVTEKSVNPGDHVQEGTVLFEIANLSKVWVLLDVYESDMPWIKKGNDVSFTIGALPGEAFDGKIAYIDPVIDPNTRVAKARVEVNNKDLKLKPEMFVSGTVEAQLPMENNAVVIPKSAVMWTGKRSVVYIKSTNERGVSFTMREVKLGPALGESYIIESGLEEGEAIAVHGTFSIDAAAQLAGKPSMMNPEGSPTISGHNHGTTTQSSASAPSEQTKQIAINNEAKEAIKPLVLEYIALKNALVDDDITAAKTSAKAFRDNLSTISLSLFTGESHNVWMKYNSRIAQSIKQVADAENIAEVRSNFLALSEAMIGLVETFRPIAENLYIQHCPMANSDKGADWLSLSKEIRNPYFGEAMLTCGEVTKEIK